MPVMHIKRESADPVKKPAHYTYGRYEAIDVIEELTAGASGPEGFLLGNVLKYLWRYRRKNGIEDLKKARRYIEMLIMLYEEMDGTRADTAILDVAPAAWEDSRPIYNKAAAEAAARHIGEMGEFFDELTRDGKRSPGRLGSINPDSPAPFTGLVCIGKDKYITMPYKFFSPLPKTGADEKPQEKPEA